MKRLGHRWTVRGLLVLAIEAMALASLWLRDLPLAAMLQVLAVLVLCVDELERSLPARVDLAEAASGRLRSPSTEVTGDVGCEDG